MSKKMGNGTWYVLAAIAVLIVVVIALKSKNSGPEGAGQPQDTNSPTPSTSTKPTTGQDSYFEGTLKNSDNMAKGNLMLSTGGKNIYLNTRRDYNALLDKQVKLFYQGSPTDFSITNIVAQ